MNCEVLSYDTSSLVIRFETGSVYHYCNVPGELVKQMLEGDAGKVFFKDVAPKLHTVHAGGPIDHSCTCGLWHIFGTRGS